MQSEPSQTPDDYEAPKLVCYGTIVEMTGGQQTNVSGGGGGHDKLPIVGGIIDALF